MIIGFLNEEGTAYDTEKKMPVGSVSIKELLSDYKIIVYDFKTGSWDVEEFKIEKGLSAAKIKAESMLNKLISLN